MTLSNFIQSNDNRSDIIPTAQPVDGALPGGGFNISDIFSGLFGQSELLTFGGILGVLGILWSIFAVLSYIVAIILLVLYVYASVQKSLYGDLQTQKLRDMEKLYNEQYRGESSNNRLKDVFTHAASENPNDWKLAIIEADIILDDILKQKGYAGNSLGERLKSISSNQLATLNDAWEAHKVRNRIAHDGSDFILTSRIAQDTLSAYQRVFAEFGVT